MKRLLILIPTLIIVGCSTTPQKAAYATVGTVQVSVDAAMNEWGAYVTAVHPPVSQELAVENAYNKYQSAFIVVCDAGSVYAATSVTNSAGTTAASSALTQAITTADQDITDLETLITSYGVKLQ